MRQLAKVLGERFLAGVVVTDAHSEAGSGRSAARIECVDEAARLWAAPLHRLYG